MSTLVLLLVVLIGIGALAYWRAPFWLWTAAAGLALLIVTISGSWPGALTAVAWLVLIAISVVFNVQSLRRDLVSKRILSVFKKVLPPMSSTEKEAIDAGTVWWDAELFSGNPNWQSLLSTPAPTLTAEEQAFLDGPVEELCRMVDDWEIFHDIEGLPDDVWAFLKKHRFFGMIIPKEHGGLGFSALAHSSVVMKICSQSGTTGVVVMVPNSLGPAELLLHYGTEEQKNYYLPRLASGDDIPCFGLTGPDAGSDAGAMPDHGIVCREDFQGRKDVLGIRLNWEKRYITLAPVSTLVGLAFKLFDPDKHLGDREDLGITVALVPADTEGVEIGNRHRPMGMAFYNGPIRGRDVFIPIEWIIGGAEMAGKGWMMLMESLAAGRSISLPSLSTGSGKLASQATGAYSVVRKQFNTSIGNFEGIQEALARIGASTYLMDAARIMTAGAVDLGEKPSVLSAIVKYHLTERMRQVINDAMDIHGGRAISRGPRNYLARGYLGVPVAITVEGANILTRNMIIFGQGAIRCHPYVLKEMEAARDSDTRRGLNAFDEALWGHVSFAVSNKARCFFLALTRARFVKPPVPGPTGKYYRQLTRMSAALALVADVSMLLLGGKLKRMERLSARLGDVLSYLYLASAALKRFEDQGRPAADLPLLDWACQDALFRIQMAFDRFFRNFPNRFVGISLRLLVFPLGRRYRVPGDQLGEDVARLLMSPSEARDRLIDGTFVGSETHPTGRVEDAFLKVYAARAAERKLRDAIKAGKVSVARGTDIIAAGLEAEVLSAEEAEQLSIAEAARSDAIAVDDFPPESFGIQRSRRPAGTRIAAEAD